MLDCDAALLTVRVYAVEPVRDPVIQFNHGAITGQHLASEYLLAAGAFKHQIHPRQIRIHVVGARQIHGLLPKFVLVLIMDRLKIALRLHVVRRESFIEIVAYGHDPFAAFLVHSGFFTHL